MGTIQSVPAAICSPIRSNKQNMIPVMLPSPLPDERNSTMWNKRRFVTFTLKGERGLLYDLHNPKISQDSLFARILLVTLACTLSLTAI